MLAASIRLQIGALAQQPPTAPPSASPAPSPQSATTQQGVTPLPSEQGQPSQSDVQVQQTVIVTANRLPVPLDIAPAAITAIEQDEIVARQVDTVAEALRVVPGMTVTESGAPGQLTDVFTRGLSSDHTLVMIDGIPVNQGLAALFDFANLGIQGINRIEVERGPQSTLYGPRALAGVIQMFTRRGDRDANYKKWTMDVTSEAGSFNTFRERASMAGQTCGFDYALSAGQANTDNDRPNNRYRSTGLVSTFGYSAPPPQPQPLPYDKNATTCPAKESETSPWRLGCMIIYINAKTGDPNTIIEPALQDTLITEEQFYAPNFSWNATPWWQHKVVTCYDKERIVNNPTQDLFVGPTRGGFQRYQLDYQNNIEWTSWLTITSGTYYEQVKCIQLQPLISQAYGPEPTALQDYLENEAGFVQATLWPIRNLMLVGGGRYDFFNQFGSVWSYRFAGSYFIPMTQTTFRGSVATGFSPPSPQDQIYGDNFDLDPEDDFGVDIGFEQAFCKGNAQFGANYFHNDLSNVIGSNLLGNTFNLGSAKTQGLEFFGKWQVVTGLNLRVTYYYLDAYKTSSADVGQYNGARLVRRPRQEAFLSASYKFCQFPLTFAAESKFVNARQDNLYTNYPDPTANFDLPDYTYVRFLADYYYRDHLRVFFRVENCLNEAYQEVYGYPALRRAYYGGLTYTF